MSTRLGRICEMIMEAGWLVAAVTVPLFFNMTTATVFEPDKAALLQVIAGVMVLAWAARFLQRPVGWVIDRIGGAISSARTPAAEVDDYDPPEVIITPLDEPAPRQLTGLSVPLPNLLVILAALMAVLVLLSTVTSSQGWSSLLGSYQRAQGLFTVLSYVAIFLLLAGNLRSRAQVERLFLAVTLGSLPVAAYAIVQAVGADPLPWGTSGVVSSTLGNASFLGGYLAVVLPLSLAGALMVLAPLRGVLRADRPRGLGLFAPLAGDLLVMVIVYLPALLLQLLALLLTGTVYAIPGLILTGLLFTLFLFAIVFLSIQRRTSQLAGVVLTAVGAVVIAVALLGAVGLAFTDLMPAQAVSLGDEGEVRPLIWPGARAVVTEWPAPNPAGDWWSTLRPAVGYGPETFAYAFNQVYPLDLVQAEQGSKLVDRPHNTLLLVTGELGYVGLALHLGLLVAGFLVGLYSLARGRSAYYRLALAGLMAALIAWVIYAQFYPVPTSLWLFFWLLLGLLVAVGRQARERPPEEEVYRASALAESQRAYAAFTGLLLLGVTSTAFYLANFSFTRWESLPLELAILAGPWVVLALLVGLMNLGVGFWWRRRLDADAEQSEGRGARAAEGARLGWMILLLLVAVVAALVSLGLILVVVNATFGGATQVNLKATPELVVALTLVSVVVGMLVVAFSLKRPAVPLKPLGWSAPVTLVLVAPAVLIVALLLVGAVFFTVYQPLQADIVHRQALAYGQARQWERSIELHQQVVDLAPNRDWYYTFLGRAYFEAARGTRDDLAQCDEWMEKGIDALTRGRELNSLNPDHAANLGRFYATWAGMTESAAVQDTRIDKAGTHYEAAVRLTPHNVKLLREMGDMYFNHGRLAEAARAYERIVELVPGDAAAWSYLAEIYKDQKKTDQAIAAYEKVTVLVPDDYRPYWELAVLYQSAGDKAKSLEMAQKALERAPASARPGIQQLINELGG